MPEEFAVVVRVTLPQALALVHCADTLKALKAMAADRNQWSTCPRGLMSLSLCEFIIWDEVLVS